MRFRLTVFVVLLMGFGLFISEVVPTAKAEVTKLTYSNFFPATHVQSKLAEEWGKEVEKRTNGKVKVEYYPGQTLTKADVVYDGVVNGISDIGFSVLGYTRGRFPIMEVIDLPLGYKDAGEATSVANEVYGTFKDKALTDTQVMYLHAHGPGLLHTKDKAVRKLEDVKGLRLRSTGTSAKVAKALGASPVAQPMPETYQSLQKGVVDGSLYPLESNKGWKLGEVIDYATLDFPAAYTTTFFVVMNKDKWKALPDDVKEAMAQINQEWIPKHVAAWNDSDKDGIAFLKEKKKEIISLDESEQARWKEAVKPVLSDFVVEMTAKNLPGQEALDTAQKSLNSARK